MGALLRVLQIEDSESDAALVVRLLEKAQYEVYSERVEDGVAMREALDRQVWDVIIADYHLPQFDAPAALQILRDTGQDIPFIVVSARIGEDVAVAMMKSGAQDYLLKDNLARLVPAVEREIRDARARQERKRAEDALYQSQERFRAAFDNAAIGMVLATIDGRLTAVNDAICEMLGYSREALVGKHFQEFTHAEDHLAGAEAVRKMLAGESQRVILEKRYLTKEGGVVRAQVLSAVLHDAAGLPTGFVTQIQDVTERRKADEVLQQSEARERARAAELQAVMDALPVALFLSRDPECHHMVGSRATYELLQLPPGSNISRFAAERAGSKGARYVRQGKEIPLEELPMQRACATGHAVRNQELEVAFEDGTSRTLFGDAVPMLDENGRTRGVVAALMDITSQKQADAELRRTHGILDAIVRDSPVPIWALDLDETVTLWNPAAERLFGWKVEEVAGKPLPTIIDHELFRESLAEVRAGAVVLNTETRCRRKDGVTLDVSLSISPLRDETGSTNGCVAALQDITDKKRMDEQLRHTQKLESIGVLAGGVAHDFNNLLTGIMGHASLVAEALPAEARHSAEEIVRSSERAADLTRQLLAYAGKGRFVLESLNLSSVVTDTTELIHAAIPKKVELRLDLNPALPFIEGDPSQMQQIVMNLVINAAEAIGGKNAGHIVASTRAVQIADARPELNPFTGQLVTPGPYVCLEVADDGCGMDAQTQARMFEPFFTTKFTGRGLGLAGVVGIVRSHRGFLEVATAPGAGTTIRVFVPASTGAVPRGAPAGGQAEAGDGETVLFIDDEEPVRTFGAAALSRFGYRPLVAENGLAGLQILNRHPDIRVVVLDLMMPAMSGDEVLEVLRGTHPSLRVILSSGFSETEAKRMFGSHAVCGFIQKPYRARDLAAHVRAAIDHAAPGRSWL